MYGITKNLFLGKPQQKKDSSQVCELTTDGRVQTANAVSHKLRRNSRGVSGIEMNNIIVS